jgi:hypothetical protein
VKALFVGKIVGILIGLCGIAAAQPGGEGTNAPVPVVAAAVNAVRDLGSQVVQGHYAVAVERMNPLWKERTAARIGGEAAMKKQLAEVSRQMIQQGITITSFQPDGQPRSYEVGPGKRVETINGRQVESLIYTKWLVLVPTLTKFSLIPPGSTKPVIIDSTGFQVAISDKGKSDWTFIDGSSLTLNDLRKLFINLPQDLVLPPIGKKESR